LLITDSAEPISSSSNQQQEEGEEDAAPTTGGSKVLEGSCVVVCDDESVSQSQVKDTFWSVPSKRFNQKVAFTVVRNDSPLEMSGSVINFDYAEVNKGNAYSLQASAFTAPVDGIYMFEFIVFKRLNRSPLKIALTVSDRKDLSIEDIVK